ncbi:Nif3-like dinuclear metal center hexameric protein [Halocalculus aciditolerans]|uniref:Nif3-like dinuclear metal center hexameric protein n=1 Tax=Halocalculus aciditolerans TaxID=1383812 RepID=A0A830F3E0_9EURY|nr:Nif3-like dinuclear metal center hexameric protein [Halocalculus aciditolerans]GGL51217.1 Nif3-like dinuclear metal center hexameric protein [Halocalculus aciditolerans]
MERSEFVARLDEELETAAYADVDASANGLQVGSLEGEVESAAFAVDAVEATVEEAVERDADVLVTHHGVVWGGLDRVTGRSYERIAPLVENDIALYVSHLPLDGHQELGNAAGIADLFDLGNRAPFGSLGPEYVGTQGLLPEALAADEVKNVLEDALDTGPGSVRVLDFGPDELEQLAVLTGSGTDWLDEAVDAGADALVTGEGKGKVYHEAREAGITVFLAGHYATETFGVESLQALAGDWGVETTFVDHPTGL